MTIALNILWVGNPLEPNKGNYGREFIIAKPMQIVEGWIPTLKIRITSSSHAFYPYYYMSFKLFYGSQLTFSFVVMFMLEIILRGG